MLLLAALLPLLLCDFLMMRVIVARSERALDTRGEAALAALHEDMDWLLASLEDAAESLADNTAVRSALRRGGDGSRLAYQVLYQNTGQLRQYARFELYDSAGQCRYSTAKVISIEALDPAWGILYSAGESRGLACRAGEDQGLLAAQAVRTHTGEILGYVVITVDQSGFDKLFGGHLDPGSDLILVDAVWHNLYCSQSSHAAETVQALREQLLSGGGLTGDGTECRYTVAAAGGGDFRLILQQPRTYTSTVMKSVNTVSVVTGLLCLLLSLWASWMFSRYLSRPVHDMDRAMGLVEKGDYDVRIEAQGEDEFGRLASSFNRMAAEYRQNLSRSVQRQKELNDTQLLMMQAQLNPHFLYNTLDSIKWMGVTNGVPQIGDITTDLAELLRAGISGDKLITLEEELELVERYLDIQSIRFGDSFTCEIDVDERFQHCILPKLVLQPLVENAIIHGVAGMDDGFIKLWAEQAGDDLRLVVSDNGRGFPPELLEKLNSPDKAIPGGHLGLNNVDKIIRLYYGESYGIRARSTPGEGSRVELLLPMNIARQKGGEENAEGIGRG